MRVMIDTNIYISAVLFPKGKTSSALKKALLALNELLDSSLAVIDVEKPQE